MKRIVRYLQDQAVQASDKKWSGSSYLSPTSKEPQQRERHHSPSQHKEQPTSHHQARAEHPSTAAHSFPVHSAAGTGIPKSNGQRDSSPSLLPEKLQQGISKHQYAQENILQSYDVYLPEIESSRLTDSKGLRYWVIYVHGGYFRDPTVTSSSFYPALGRLIDSRSHGHLRHLRHQGESSQNIRPYIAGYASINYRLSPHPESPQDSTKVSDYELRSSKWPEHIDDVLSAIRHLQAKYGFGERYLLVGHSVGATMAILSTVSATKTFTTETPRNVPAVEPPVAVLGVSGIYDFPLLHESFPEYVEITRNAIPNEHDDVLASPAQYQPKDYEHALAPGKKRILVIAHSKDDGKVDWRQVEAMEMIFPGIGEASSIEFKVLELRGQHDEIWEKGTELATAIIEALRMLKASETPVPG